MTLVGHSIMGLSLGIALMPKGLSRRTAGGFLLLMAAMACLPDWRIPFRSHLFSYNQHHSLLVNCVIVACIGLAMASFGGSRAGGAGSCSERFSRPQRATSCWTRSTAMPRA